MNESKLVSQLSEGKAVICHTVGVSMRPLLKEGKTCVVVLPVSSEIKVGDILLFVRQSDNANVLHRLIKINGDTYITRGDNCHGCEHIKREQIVGRVDEIIKGQKTISVTDKGYLRYVRFWNFIWFLRCPYYCVRIGYNKLKDKVFATSVFKALRAKIRGSYVKK